MTKKGFTLAELLGVIIVIGLLALLIVPAVDRSIDNSKNKAYEAQIKNIERVAEDWAMEHMGELPKINGEFSYVYLGQLVYGGYLDDDIRDPRTGKRLSYAVQIKISRKNNSYVFEVVEGSGIDGVFDNGIMISLNGNDTIDIGVGDTYNELGAVAKTFSGLDVSDRIEISSNLDTTNVGTYFVTYKLSYEGGTIEKKRTVNVKNMKPVITLNPNGTNGYSKALTVGVNASVFGSNSINSLTYKVNGGPVQNVVNNTIIFDTSGVYTLEIIAVDMKGNTSTLTSNEYYVDATPPTITFEEGNNEVILSSEEAELYNLMTGVIVSDSGGDSNITLDDVVTIGDVSSSAGIYTVTYRVTDKVGNVTEKARTLRVVIMGDGIPFANVMSSASNVMNNDPDGNLRYVGATPNNYVRFNNELWRIIGVFGGQAKIIKDDYYVTEIRWDVDNKNNWSTASLQEELNSTYLNGIESVSKSYIDQAHVWKLGGVNAGTSTTETGNWTRSNLYTLETGNTVYSGNPVTWTGAVGLLYLSDYGYSTSSSCDMTLFNWNDNSVCYTNSWLYDADYNQWVITSASDANNKVFYLLKLGRVFVYEMASDLIRSARPVVYLKPNVGIVGGSGSDTDPYILGFISS